MQVPRCQLLDFRKLHLAPGMASRVSFEVQPMPSAAALILTLTFTLIGTV